MFFFLQLAARAYGVYGTLPTDNNVKHFKELSSELILLRNLTAHFEDLASLEGLLKNCKIVIKEWPSLKLKFQRQVTIIKNYREFKILLPTMFLWTPSRSALNIVGSYNPQFCWTVARKVVISLTCLCPQAALKLHKWFTLSSKSGTLYLSLEFLWGNLTLEIKAINLQ